MRQKTMSARMAIKEWVTFMSVRNVAICFDFRASLQRVIKLMNVALVLRSVEPANWSRRRVPSLIWWSEHPVPGRPDTVR